VVDWPHPQAKRAGPRTLTRSEVYEGCLIQGDLICETSPEKIWTTFTRNHLRHLRFIHKINSRRVAISRCNEFISLYGGRVMCLGRRKREGRSCTSSQKLVLVYTLHTSHSFLRLSYTSRHRADTQIPNLVVLHHDS
jgi:hypothetical protein